MNYLDVHIKLKSQGYKHWYTNWHFRNPNFSGFILYSLVDIDPRYKVELKNVPMTVGLALESAEFIYDIKNKLWLKERTSVKELGEPTETERLIYGQ